MKSSTATAVIAPGTPDPRTNDPRAYNQTLAAPRPSAPQSRPSWLTLSTFLVAINVIVFVLMVLTGVSPIEPTTGQLLKWGANWGPLSLSTQPWRMLTSNYVHIGIVHIFFNMWCLFNLGALAEKIFERWTYVLIYTATGIFASLASLWWHPTVVGAGASGAIFGLAGALLAALYLGKLPLPKQAIQSTMKSLLIFAAYNLFFGLRPGVDNSAHIGGLVSGLALGAFLSGHLLDPLEVRRQWRNYALIFSLAVLAVGGYYVRNQHPELGGLTSPNEYAVQYDKALEAFRRKDPAAAVAACEKVVKLNPRSAESHFLLGVAYESADRPDDAITQFQETLRLDPKYADAETGLAESYAAKGMETKSQEAYKRAAALKGH
jgi:membrane associated rhomboid family serine protease